MLKKIVLYSCFSVLFLAAYSAIGQITGAGGDVYINPSEFTPTVKDAVKQSDLPEITDTVKKIEKINYTIQSSAITTKYKVEPIQQAKMVNEPLSKLYYSLVKFGFGNYTMPYGELFLNNLRSREAVYGMRYRHLSSRATLDKLGFSGFSDNELAAYGKKFYKKHTLSGDFNYTRNVVHFYGFPDSLFKGEDNDFTKQRFNIFDAKINLMSHYTDSTKINHDIHLNYYNIGDINNTFENNVYADGLIRAHVSGEKLNVFLSTDYYNLQSNHDTVSNFIMKVNPYFEAGGEKWKADIGVTAALDKFNGIDPKFYFYPRLNVHYNVYNNIVIPYAGLSGGLQKNSFRSYVSANPFVLSELQYKNTNNAFNVFGGLRGALSSNTSYDAKVTYGKYTNMPFFIINYDNFLSNRFNVIYDKATLLTVSGQLKYQFKEKLNITGKGNYYSYKTDSIAYAWHKPKFDITLSGLYNLKSKIIVKADLFYIGSQLAYQRTTDKAGNYKYEKAELKGIADINLGAEYRYSKMLSFFVNFNNIGNFRYYRWDRYPTQRFNAMVGVTFVPF
ncbi:MAG: hypothetical protein ACJ76F_12600 [Bacteroidia bacterium]